MDTATTYRPSLSFYHANGKGTGSAVKMELHPAHDQTEGSIMMSVARQATVGDRSGKTPTFPRFDWNGKIVVKLGFADLSKILQVLRGECEAIDDGKGLFHRTDRFSTRISLRHILEPVHGYVMDIFRSAAGGGGETKATFVFSPHEAVGLTASLESSFGVICFGIPVVHRRTEAGGTDDDAV